ncbi:MAG: hypothetical protein SPL79_07750, partial [Sphaerochaetaceae bacterium]|nr:hypothetical protein [Sphaerochaetaceae bacterium]
MKDIAGQSRFPNTPTTQFAWQAVDAGKDIPSLLPYRGYLSQTDCRRGPDKTLEDQRRHSGLSVGLTLA